jgi:alpha-tubulin suppressor-like RCC1 family protein
MLYGCGNNGEKQLSEKGSRDNFHLLPRGETSNVRLKMTACGGYFSVVLSEEGGVYACGQV